MSDQMERAQRTQDGLKVIHSLLSAIDCSYGRRERKSYDHKYVASNNMNMKKKKRLQMQ